MKKSILLFIIFFSIKLMAQPTLIDRYNYELDKTKWYLKSNKKSLFLSGCLLLMGSTTSIIATCKNEPSVNNYINLADYYNDLELYQSNQKTLKQFSSVFYSFSGILLVSIYFDF